MNWGFSSEFKKNKVQAQAGKIYLLPVLVNYVCQLDWVIRCPDIWLNIILGMSVRVFLEMNI